MAITQKKINNSDLPNLIGQQITIAAPAKGTAQFNATVVAAGPDGKTVLVRHNKLWFYVATTYDSTQYIYQVIP